MYLQIENEFKENSRIRSSQILFIVGAILFVLINSSFLDQIRASNFTNEYYLLVFLGDTFLFYFICYLFVFFKGTDKRYRSVKNFISVHKTIHAYQDKLHEKDISILKEILQDYNIDTRPKVEEAIRHYQCLLPRKVSQTGQLLSILALVVSILALLVSEMVSQSVENVEFILGIILTVIIIYIVVRLIEKNVFRIFGKDALYTRIEDSLSEIFMTYYLKKDK